MSLRRPKTASLIGKISKLELKDTDLTRYSWFYFCLLSILYCSYDCATWHRTAFWGGRRLLWVGAIEIQENLIPAGACKNNEQGVATSNTFLGGVAARRCRA